MKFKIALNPKFILVCVTVFIGVLLGYFTVSLLRISADKVVVSNRTDRSATISWVSTKKDSGVAIAYKGEASLPIWVSRNGGDAVAYDDRDLKAAELKSAEKSAESVGESPSSEVRFEQVVSEIKIEEMGEYYLHHVTFTDLEPDTEYEFLLGDGVMFKRADVSSFKTFGELDTLDVPEPAYGIVLEPEVEEGFNSASSDSVVYLQVEFEDGVKSQVLSSVTSENGSWYIDLSMAKSEEGESLGKVVDGLKEIVTVEGGPVGSIEQFETFTDFDAPTKPMILGEETTLQSKAPLDFFASEVHAACCNSFVCSTGESYGDDPSYGGGDCNTRHSVCGGTVNVVSQGNQCGTSSGSGGSGTTSNGDGGSSSTGSGSCEGVSISCPAGWSKEGDVYCENGSSTCKLKCVKNGESPWWHEGGSCQTQSSPPPANSGSTGSTGNSGGIDCSDSVILGGSTRVCEKDGCQYYVCAEACFPTGSANEDVCPGNPKGLRQCHSNCSGAQKGVTNSYNCVSTSSSGATTEKTCCNAGYRWDDDASACELVDAYVRLGQGGTCPSTECFCEVSNQFINQGIMCTAGAGQEQESDVSLCHLNCSESTAGVANSYSCVTGSVHAGFSQKNCCNEGYQWHDQSTSCVSVNPGGSDPILPPVQNGTEVIAEVPVVPVVEDRLGEGLVWEGNDTGARACLLGCNGECVKHSAVKYGYLKADTDRETTIEGANSRLNDCSASQDRFDCEVWEVSHSGDSRPFASPGYDESALSHYYVKYTYLAEKSGYYLEDGTSYHFSSYWMCEYPDAQNNSLDLVPKTYAQTPADGDTFLFDPRSETYYVGEAGEYILEYEGEEYRAIVQDSEQEVLLYIDQDNNGQFDEGVDAQIVEEPVLLNISQVSKGYEYVIKQGFNLVHFPFVLDENNTAASLLEYLNISSGDSIYSIAKYDGTWKVVGSNGGDFDTNDFQIVPGVGYLIRSKSNIEVTLFGKDIIFESEEDSAPVFLSPGWNLMGIYGTNAKTYTAESLIDGINGFSEVDFSVNNVSSWSVSKGRYEGLQKDVIDAEVSDVYGFDFPLTQGSGYFVRVTDGVGNWEPEKN